MNIGLLGCKGTTLDLLNHFTENSNFNINFLITLSEENAKKNKVAFYQGNELVNYCKSHEVPFHITQTYHLKNEEDLKWFNNVNIDLLIVIGWERLVPDDILKTLGKFACGMHGSPYGLPKGRGRSPLNWSVLTGHTKFVTNLFKYDPYVDAGEIIGFKVFDINKFDTISSLHHKNRIVMQQLLETYIPLIKEGEVSFYPQPPLTPSFYPKRTEEDSLIDWNTSTENIYNLVRAVSHPYPSAFTFYKNTKIIIHKAYPFDTALYNSNTLPGTIVDLSISLQQMVVKTLSGSLLITEIEGIAVDSLKVGDKLKSGCIMETMKRISMRYGEEVSESEREIRF